jgi:hypothetical protein
MTDWISERKRIPLARTVEFIETAQVICPSGCLSNGASSCFSDFPKTFWFPRTPNHI